MNVETSWYSITAKGDGKPAEIAIYDEIGLWGVTAKDFIHELKKIDANSSINLTLHTPGGSIGDGSAIYNEIKRHAGKVVVTVDTLAASMGSVIALAGDETHIVDNGFIMVHNASGAMEGTADEMEKAADTIRKYEQNMINIYVERTGLSEEEVRELCKETTWMNAQEAVELGFAHKVVKATKAAATLKNFKGARACALNNKRPLPAGSGPKPDNKQHKEAIMENDNTKELQARIEKLEADLANKEKEIEQIMAGAEAVAEEQESKMEAVRGDAAELVRIAKAHGKLDMAVAAIEDGKSVAEFKDSILNSYAEGNAPETIEENPAAEFDPNKEPKDKAEFLQTHATLSGAKATAYFRKYRDLLTK